MFKQKLLDELQPLLPDNQVAAVIADRLRNEQDEEAIKDYLAMCKDTALAILLAAPHKVVTLGPSETKKG